MNGIQIRELYISQALQVIDAHSKTIEQLQAQIAEKDRRIAELEKTPTVLVPAN